MPIANCILAPGCELGGENLISLWADESAQSAQHMTVNIIRGSTQLGNRYQVMATLLLPSIWSKADVSSLQTGLARALARYFQVAISEVQVVTTIVESGMVVEDGEEIQW
jgi:hypothetical protein